MKLYVEKWFINNKNREEGCVIIVIITVHLKKALSVVIQSSKGLTKT